MTKPIDDAIDVALKVAAALDTVGAQYFFAHAHGPFDEAEFERRRPVVVRDEQTLVIKSPEDTILRKLLWYREGGEMSDRQWRDILGVLRGQQGVLDIDYLRHWATKLQLVPLLERAMNKT